MYKIEEFFAIGTSNIFSNSREIKTKSNPRVKTIKNLEINLYGIKNFSKRDFFSCILCHVLLI